MPFTRRKSIEIEQQFVRDTIDGHLNFTEHYRVYGFSRPTGYKWLKRFKTLGEVGLEESSSKLKK